MSRPAAASGVRGALSWSFLSNFANAAGNALALVVLAHVAPGEGEFSRFAVSSSVLVFAYAIGRAALGENMILRWDHRPSRRALAAAVMIVAPVLAVPSGLLAMWGGTGVAVAGATAAAVLCFVFNDCWRHWAFAVRAPRVVAAADSWWFVATGVIGAIVLLTGSTALLFHLLWSASALVFAVPCLLVRDRTGIGVASGARWLADGSATVAHLCVEALFATSAVTLPLIVAGATTADAEAVGAVRLLQAVFGFQQIAYFSALVAFGRAREGDAALARRAGLGLALIASLLSVAVGVGVVLAPEGLIEGVLGDPGSTVVAHAGWFALSQVALAFANGGLLAARISGRAAEVTVGRVSGSIIATVGAIAALQFTTQGYAIGTAVGFGISAVAIWWRLADQSSRSGGRFQNPARFWRPDPPVASSARPGDDLERVFGGEVS